jgi:putative chitinase
MVTKYGGGVASFNAPPLFDAKTVSTSLFEQADDRDQDHAANNRHEKSSLIKLSHVLFFGEQRTNKAADERTTDAEQRRPDETQILISRYQRQRNPAGDKADNNPANDIEHEATLPCGLSLIQWRDRAGFASRDGKVDLRGDGCQHPTQAEGGAGVDARRAQTRLVAAGFAIGIDGDFGGKSYAALMSYVGRRTEVDPLRAALGKAAARYFPNAKISSSLRIAHVLAQQCVETGRFGTLVESLNYSEAGLLATFSRSRISAADCARLGRKATEGPLSPERQQAIANIVYGGAFGRDQLGNTQPGDGWRFRGRGAKQTTGRTNYARVKALTGIDVITSPALLEDPDNGMRAATLFWTDKRCNGYADADDIEALTRAVNGGINGLADRRVALDRAKAILLA